MQDETEIVQSGLAADPALTRERLHQIVEQAFTTLEERGGIPGHLVLLLGDEPVAEGLVTVFFSAPGIALEMLMRSQGDLVEAASNVRDGKVGHA